MFVFADVIVPVPLYSVFTYSVPEEMTGHVAVGMRVIVKFSRKTYTAVVRNLHEEDESYVQNLGYEVKPIVSVLDKSPLVLQSQLDLWKWISDYYQCPIGDIFKAAVPSELRLESESLISLTDVEDYSSLTESEMKVVGSFSVSGAAKKSMNLTTISKITGISNIMPVVRSLMQKGIAVATERVVDMYRPKTETYVSFSPAVKTEEDASKALLMLKRAKSQTELFASFIKLTKAFTAEQTEEISKNKLLEVSSATGATLKALVDKGYLVTYNRAVSRLYSSEKAVQPHYELNEEQSRAYNEIKALFKVKNTVLLHGVTASGKTEVYIHLIEDVVASGRQVLFLLPEIALTEQITDRLRRVFGDKLVVYHSKYTDAERVEIWKSMLSDSPYRIILGARSSIFLPFQSLGLIIVDEEHESSYKQVDPSPRYNARNTAIMLSMMNKDSDRCRCLLGSATPSLESYNNAMIGRYGLVNMAKRFSDVELPEIEVVDMKYERHHKTNTGIYSSVLLSAIRKALAEKEQVILFQNRRGYSPFLQCPDCGYVPKCNNCDVSLTVHRAINALTCHYCGYTVTLPSICPSCGSEKINNVGFGTERIEDELKKIFPEARIARMDLDTTRNRNSYSRIISSFEHGEVDILIGTQMVTKGLDFRNVSTVGIINADNILSNPDFRASERAFQLMTQVSGRAGRSCNRGRVILQTSSVDNTVVSQVVHGDYKSMFKTQMIDRQRFMYPPFFRLIYVELRHPNQFTTNAAADYMATAMRKVFGSRVLGPDNPPVARVKNKYIKRIVLKIEATSSNAKAKDLLRQVSDELRQIERFKMVQIVLDVDPD